MTNFWSALYVRPSWAGDFARIAYAASLGLPGFEFDTWYGLFAPAKTPRHVIKQISVEVARILQLPDVKERFDVRGAVARPSTPEEFNQFVRAEFAKLGAIVKAANLKVE